MKKLIRRFRFWRVSGFRIWKKKWRVRIAMSLLPKRGKWLDYCDERLDKLGWGDKDAYGGGRIKDDLMQLARVFDMQGHSGMSSGICAGLFKSLVLWEKDEPPEEI